MPTLDCRHMIKSHTCNQEWVNIYRALSCKISDSDPNATEVTYINWRLPGCGSHVTITLSPGSGTDLLGCQSHPSRREGKVNKEWNNRPIYVIIVTQTSHNHLVEHNSNHLAHLAQWQTLCQLLGSGTCADANNIGPRSNHKSWEWRHNTSHEMSKLLLGSQYHHSWTPYVYSMGDQIALAESFHPELGQCTGTPPVCGSCVCGCSPPVWWGNAASNWAIESEVCGRLPISLILRLFPESGLGMVGLCLAVNNDLEETDGKCVVSHCAWHVLLRSIIVDDLTCHIWFWKLVNKPLRWPRCSQVSCK